MRNVNKMTWEQRCAADAEARDWAQEYGRGEFYYSPKWGQLTAIADGTTTLNDVADASATGTATPYHEALATHYWVQAADYLAAHARDEVTKARRGHPHEGLTDDLGQVPWLVDDDELTAAKQRQDAADAALVEARQIRDAAVEREQDQRRWEHAQHEQAYHEAGARAVLEAEVNDAWRTAVGVEYDQICADYGNDGHPENDRHISAQDKTAQAAAVTEIAQRTGLPTGAVWDTVRDVAHRYALDHTDTATLDQPDWNQVADHWAALMDHNRTDASGSEMPAWEKEADQRAYWDELGESHPAVRDAFWQARDDLGLTAEDDVDQAELDAAYTAAGEAIAAAAGLPAPDPAAASPTSSEGPPVAQVESTRGQELTDAQRGELGDQWAATDVADDPAADHVQYRERVADEAAAPRTADLDDGTASPGRDTRTPAERVTDSWTAAQMAQYTSRADPVLWGPLAPGVLDELDQARARLEAGDIEPEREHELAEYIEHLEEEAERVSGDSVGQSIDDVRLAGAESVPDELARGGDPVLAAKTEAGMTTEAAATKRGLREEKNQLSTDEGFTDDTERTEVDQSAEGKPPSYPSAGATEDLTDDERAALAHLRGRSTMGKFATGLYDWSDERWAGAINGLITAGYPVHQVHGTVADDPTITGGWVIKNPGKDATHPPERSSGQAEDRLGGEHADTGIRDPHPRRSDVPITGSGIDPIERVRAAVEHLDEVSRTQYAQQAGQVSSWRGDDDTRTAGFTSGGLGPREIGW